MSVSKMAEMTAAKVKMLLESFAAVCGSNSKAKELCGDAVGFVEQQAQEIAAANAELAELKSSLQFNFNSVVDCLKSKYDAEQELSAHYKAKAEQAEAQCAAMREVLERLSCLGETAISAETQSAT